MVEGILLPLLEVLTEIQTSDSEGREELDRILLSLSRSSAALEELLNCIIVRQELSVQPEVVAQLRELHWCTNNVLLEWEQRLQCWLTPSSGRNRKAVNIPMVCRIFFLNSLKAPHFF